MSKVAATRFGRPDGNCRTAAPLQFAMTRALLGSAMRHGPFADRTAASWGTRSRRDQVKSQASAQYFVEMQLRASPALPTQGDWRATRKKGGERGRMSQDASRVSVHELWELGRARRFLHLHTTARKNSVVRPPSACASAASIVSLQPHQILRGAS